MRTVFIRTAKSRCWITLILVFSRFRVCLAKKKKNENIFSTRCMWGTTRQQYERTHLHISVSACARARTPTAFIYIVITRCPQKYTLPRDHHHKAENDVSRLTYFRISVEVFCRINSEPRAFVYARPGRALAIRFPLAFAAASRVSRRIQLYNMTLLITRAPSRPAGNISST